MFSYERAAKYYVINRSSFSGATFNEVGQSERPLRVPALLSKTSNFKANLGLTMLTLGRQSHRTQKRFYILTLHVNQTAGTISTEMAEIYTKTFDHLKLVNILKERDNWILHNNCPEILKLYEGYDIMYPGWKWNVFGQNLKRNFHCKGKNEQKILFQ